MNMTSPSGRRLALIAGPTASGKSALALALAERAGGMVINADSAQVYADLRIISARPSPAEEERAPHRLYGYRDAAALLGGRLGGGREALDRRGAGGGPAADPRRRHRPLHPHPARRNRAGSGDRSGDTRGGSVIHRRA
jgi:hypothetical protein